MRILFISDIVGSPGRGALRMLPRLKKEWGYSFCVANGENAAAGFGLTPSTAEEIFRAGVDVITSGNHLWDRKEAMDLVAHEPRILRPANYPPAVPGSGQGVFLSADGHAVGVLNLLGRVFVREVDCPFRKADASVAELRRESKIVLVDMHAEATSEKVAMGWYLDGRVSAVVGTHTHVQTADERVLPGGTGYITDVGMTGAFDSVIGIEKEPAIRRFLTQVAVRLTPAKNDVRLNGVIVDVEPSSGVCSSITRLSVPCDAGCGPGANQVGETS
ncbi:MAG: TIGR00282 family metallophosphoesterase [Candidatus Eisenbacteria bacterium]|nr:TIGR00282 family metallophosphoesterase [Candidatus Eisenbacteria bacterium]